MLRVPAIFSKSSIAQRCFSLRSFSYLWLLPFLIVLALYNFSAWAQNAVVLVGSGSSVPAPLYNRWTQEYGKRNAKIQMRYVPIGTSEGIKEISHGASDFGAGESQLTEKERKELDRTAGRPDRNRSHLQSSRCPPGTSAFRGSAGRNFSRRREDVECTADRQAQPGYYFAESSDPGDQPAGRKGIQLRLH